MNTRPGPCIGSAYSTTSTRSVVPPLAMAPSDFSRIVVMPPALLPGAGLLSIDPVVDHGVALPPADAVVQLAAPPAARARAPRAGAPRRRSRASPRTPPCRPATRSRSDARPTTGFAAIPEYASEPPHSMPTISSLAGHGLPPHVVDGRQQLRRAPRCPPARSRACRPAPGSRARDGAPTTSKRGSSISPWSSLVSQPSDSSRSPPKFGWFA